MLRKKNDDEEGGKQPPLSKRKICPFHKEPVGVKNQTRWVLRQSADRLSNVERGKNRPPERAQGWVAQE